MELDTLNYSTDGTLEGMLTALYVAFDQQQQPQNILMTEPEQTSLFDFNVSVNTDIDQANAMKDAIVATAGELGYDKVKRLFLSDDPRRGGIAFRFLEYVMEKGRASLNHIAYPAVADADELINKVGKEVLYMIQFVRFSDIGGGLFYAHIAPKANVIPLVMGHFAKRFNVQPFIIHDSGHCLSGVFDTRSWWLVEGDPQGISLPEKTEDQYQVLWQRFFKTIAITERKNPIAQRSFMPKRFWGDMCEQKLPYERRGDELT